MPHSPAPRIHLHALCWNEERMLPFFFHHYDPFVERYYIADHRSTDRSLEILDQHPRVSLETFEFSGQSFVEAAQNHYNHCWKISRGHADWVIICNIDEHIYHPDLKAYLMACSSRGLTIIYPAGYEMVCDTFPEPNRSLRDQIRLGKRMTFFDKPEIFNPNSIEEINFALGRHAAEPIGVVHEDIRRKVKLLHYKYMGISYLTSRSSELQKGLRAKDIQKQWGRQYLLSKEQHIKTHNAIKRDAVPVFSPLAPAHQVLNPLVLSLRTRLLKLIHPDYSP